MHRAFRVSTGLTVCLILLVLLPGCRQGTFLGNRYNNFRAYYNTFYNARRAFDAGEEAIELSERQIDRSRFISIFPATQSGASSGGTQFEEAIEKSADLLRERPDSKWADDALLLIGKAYFYQNNFVGAEGKFRETVEAALERDQLELADEARFWLGRTLSASERFEEATAVLEEGLARPDIRPKWRSKMLLALGELYVQQRQWAEASEALRRGIPETDEKDLSGRAQFLLGQVFEADGAYEEASDAYADVARHRPIYELAYAAKLSEALVRGIDVGDTDQALDLIRGMRRDDKNFQNRAEVELAYARLLGAADQIEESEQRFDMLLYDEDFRANNVRGEAYFRYGEFLRDEGNDYVRAAAYFDTAATNVRTEPGREELVTRVALRDVQRNAEVYRSYAAIAGDLAEADSLLHLGSLDAEEFRVAIAAIESERIRRWQDEQRILAERRAEQGFGNTTIARGGEIPVESDEGRFGPGQGPGIEAGFLNYRDPARSQDALLAFERVWGDRPLAPNWRRRQALQSAVVEGSGPEGGGDPNQINLGNAAGPAPLDISNVPRTEEAQARVRGERAELRYELGNVFFLSLAKPDSAVHWYSLVLSEDSDQPVVIRAQYALAEVRGAQGRAADAEALYLQVIDEQPLSPQAAQARERLGLPPLAESAGLDSLALAQADYERVYTVWQNGEYRDALVRMLVLGEGAAGVQVPPRALLASGLIFAEWARKDGPALELGIPGELVPEALLNEAVALSQGGAAASDEGAEPASEPGEEALDDSDDQDDNRENNLQQPDLLPPPRAATDDDELPAQALPQQAQPEQPVSVPDTTSESLPTEFVITDSLAINPLATGLPDDSTNTADDSIPDTTSESLPTEIVVTDSLAINPLATGLPDDSTNVADDSIFATGYDSGPDVLPYSLGGQTVFLSLSDLYSIVEARYPGTEFAAHANARRRALSAVLLLDDDIQAPEEDSLDAVVDVMAALSQEVVDAAPEGTFGLAGDVALNTDVGGFAWKVASVPSPLAAQAMLRNFGERGLRAAVVRDSLDRRELFVLLLGQFASVEEAEGARDDLPKTGLGRDLEVVPIHNLDLLDATDLDRFRPD